MSTATEVLNLMEAGERLDMLVMDCMAFTFCSECGHVDEVEETLMNHPCQTCGVNVEVRSILFHREERILENIFECYRSNKSKELCVLLYCTLIEQHVSNLIRARCIHLKLEWLIMELLLEKYSRVDERLKLFGRLTGTSIRDALNGLSGQSVFDAYEALRKKRNGLAHGLPAAHYAIKSNDIQMAVDEAANSFATFANLYHRFCAVDSPPLPAE